MEHMNSEWKAIMEASMRAYAEGYADGEKDGYEKGYRAASALFAEEAWKYRELSK